MTPHDRALELFRLAGRDERAAHVLQADPSIDQAIVGFHYQQAAEKLLKALLAERNVDYPRTHNLGRLVELLTEVNYQVPVEENELVRLTPFAVTSRYEDDEGSQQIDPVQTQEMIAQLRAWVEEELDREESSE